MNSQVDVPAKAKALDLLSLLLFRETDLDSVVEECSKLDREGRNVLLGIADSNHVTVRALSNLAFHANSAGHRELAAWAASVVLEEKSRIERTLPRLEEVCRGLEQHGVEITVIKTLDHWPDFGRDIDVFTLAKEDRLLTAMIQEFGAELLDRSWGDRLAGKYSFAVPGLGRTLEVHVGRLGQVGEQKAVARKIQNNREPWIFNDRCFYVPAPEEQILAATLQRMYRHFFFRLSDIVNTERLVTGNRVDVESLMETARSGGIWEGTQAYLRLVNEYAEYYRSCEIPPRFKLGLRARGNFLRLAVFPQGAILYGRELLNLLGRGELASGLRLTLLPPLACAAGISFKMTGSNQGIW